MKVVGLSFAKMARYERLGGDDEEGGSDGGGGGPGLKRNLLVVVLALALFATILGNLFRCVSVFSKSVFLEVYTYEVYPAYASSKLCKFFLNCTCETSNVCIVIYQLSQELFTSPHTITGPHVLIYVQICRPGIWAAFLFRGGGRLEEGEGASPSGGGRGLSDPHSPQIPSGSCRK